MYDNRIVPALAVMGVLMTGLYAAAWWQLIGGAAPPAEPPPAVEEEPSTDQLYYRVTTADGERHVIQVSRIDAAQAVLTATERFGAGATVERLDDAQAVEHERAEAGPDPLVWTGLLILLPLTLLLAAARLSGRDAATQRVWQAIGPTLGGKGEAVKAAARVDDRGLQSALGAINRYHEAELRWDREIDRIMDLRLAHFTLTLKYCPRCNTQVHARVSADLSQIPSCLSCMAPLESKELDEQQAQVVKRLVGEAPRRADSEGVRFSPGAFIFWSLIFPPLAAAYALRSAR